MGRANQAAQPSRPLPVLDLLENPVAGNLCLHGSMMDLGSARAVGGARPLSAKKCELSFPVETSERKILF